MLSSWRAEKERCVTGRVWPGATRGTDFRGVVILYVRIEGLKEREGSG